MGQRLLCKKLDSVQETKAFISVKQYSQFILPDLGDKVDSCIGLSCWPARLHSLAGRYDKSTTLCMPESTISPFQGL